MSLRQVLSGFGGRHILVFGDVMVDEYIWGTASRISPEAPVPVVQVSNGAEDLRLGGAANVAANIRALGGKASLVGVVGNDAPGERLRHQLERAGLKADGIVIDRGRPTTVKTRVVAGSQHVVRFDREETAEVGSKVSALLSEHLRHRLAGADALVVSDYGKGAASGAVLRRAIPLARRMGKLVAVDPKGLRFEKYRGATLLAPNHHEAARAAHLPDRTEADVVRAGRFLLKRLSLRAVVITRGGEGLSLIQEGEGSHHIPAVVREVYDVTGAGDTVIGALALAVAAGATFREAAWIANQAAGIVVAKRGTATASLAELRRAIQAAGPA